MPAARNPRGDAVGVRLPSEGGGWIFERLVTSLLLLLVAAASAFVLLAALGLVSANISTPFGFTLSEYLRFDDDPDGLMRISVGAGAALVGLLSVALLIRRLSGAGGMAQPSYSHVLVADEQGLVRVDTRGICTVATTAAARTQGVMEARVQVASREGEPLRLRLSVWVSAAAEVGRTGDEARKRASEAVERLVGLEVNQVVVDVQVVPLSQVGRMLE
jgi:uncharacterized alkaline shock family protein YloU